MSLNVIGISAFYHDSACCLIQDGKLIAAVEEERFTRIKHDASLPINAFLYCLKAGNVSIDKIDCIAFYEDPRKKFARQICSGIAMESLAVLNPNRVEYEIRDSLGYSGDVRFYDHHLSHAASSFFFSGFDKAAVMTMDGVGEWATTTFGVGSGTKIDIIDEVHFPHSIGLLYSTITNYLGFEVNDGEYKVMGLAPYGKPIYVDHIFTLLKNERRGQFSLDLKYFDFVRGKKMFSPALGDLLGFPPRQPGSEMKQCYKDLSRSLQVALEMVLMDKVKYLHEVTQIDNLCLAGGVALNCVANGKIAREGPFENVFIQPASSDSGGALGCAALAYASRSKEPFRLAPMTHAYLGPSFQSDEIETLLGGTGLINKDFRNKQDELIDFVAAKLEAGKVAGWFQGAMEFGPRALGARSIIADPRNPKMRELINSMIKKREGFRPFAPVVLEEYAARHFEIDHPSPFMLETFNVNSEIDLPAITHIDNSARVQTLNKTANPKFHSLIERFFELTGCPVLLNTSFNVKDEPIVCTPEDALICFINSNLDLLVLEDFVIERSQNNVDTLSQAVDNYKSSIFEPAQQRRNDIYTFTSEPLSNDGKGN